MSIETLLATGNESLPLLDLGEVCCSIGEDILICLFLCAALIMSRVGAAVLGLGAAIAGSGGSRINLKFHITSLHSSQTDPPETSSNIPGAMLASK